MASYLAVYIRWIPYEIGDCKLRGYYWSSQLDLRLKQLFMAN